MDFKGQNKIIFQYLQNVFLEKEKNIASEELITYYATSYSYDEFVSMMEDAKKRRIKSFHIKDINIVDTKESNEEIQSLFLDVDLAIMANVSSKRLSRDRMGVFHVEFSNGEHMVFGRWSSGEGRNRLTQGMFLAKESTWLEFLKMTKGAKRKKQKPPKGKVYKVTNGRYIEKEGLVEMPVVHKSLKIISEDLENFFGNINMFTRFGLSGQRKVLLVGPHGTGKTSAAIKMATKHKSMANVSFFTDVKELAVHLSNCAKHKMKTICILEDAEMSLSNASSSILNFLDGIDQPRNKQGAYIIMTTNHPNKIEPRILKRPGRIDMIVGFGNLTGQYSMRCAEIYFEDIIFGKDKLAKGNDKELKKQLKELLHNGGKGTTGARIKQLSEDVLSYAVSNQKEKITFEEIEKIFLTTEDNMKNVENMIREQGIFQGDKIGFGRNREDSHKEDEEEVYEL